MRALPKSRSRISCESFDEKQKPRKSKRKLSRVILKNYTFFAFLYCIARRYTALYCIARRYTALYCIARRYTAFYTALRGAIPYTVLAQRYTYTALTARYPALYSLTRRYTVYCISAALYRILHWCGAIPLWCRLYPPLPLRSFGWIPPRPFCCL